MTESIFLITRGENEDFEVLVATRTLSAAESVQNRASRLMGAPGGSYADILEVPLVGGDYGPLALYTAVAEIMSRGTVHSHRSSGRPDLYWGASGPFEDDTRFIAPTSDRPGSVTARSTDKDRAIALCAAKAEELSKEAQARHLAELKTLIDAQKAESAKAVDRVSVSRAALEELVTSVKSSQTSFAIIDAVGSGVLDMIDAVVSSMDEGTGF